MKVHLLIIFFITHVAGLGIIVPSTLINGTKTQVMWTQEPSDSTDFDLRFVATPNNTDVGLAAANIQEEKDYGIVNVIFPGTGTFVLIAVTGSSRNIVIGTSTNVTVVALPVSATTTVTATTTVLPTPTPTRGTTIRFPSSSTASSTPTLPTSSRTPSSIPLSSFVSSHSRRRLPVLIGALIGSFVLLVLLTAGVIVWFRRRRSQGEGRPAFTFRRSLMVRGRVPPLLPSTIVTPPESDPGAVDPERALPDVPDGESDNAEEPPASAAGFENNFNPFIARSPRGPRPRTTSPGVTTSERAANAPTTRQGLLLTRIAAIQAQIRELQSFRATSSTEERQAIVRVIENLYRQLRWLREQVEGDWAKDRTDDKPPGWDKYMMSEVRGRDE